MMYAQEQEILSIAIKMAQELQEFVGDAEQSGSTTPLPGTVALIEEWESAYQALNAGEVQSGVTHTGISNNELETDIQMLLESDHVDLPDLRALCSAITDTTKSLESLYALIEKHMMHKTNGSCHGLDILGNNRLLSMFFNSGTTMEFNGGIENVKRKVERILAGKEQAALF